MELNLFHFPIGFCRGFVKISAVHVLFTKLISPLSVTGIYLETGTRLCPEIDPISISYYESKSGVSAAPVELCLCEVTARNPGG